ncbi:MAG: ATP-dependent DNA helicase RecQ [Nitrospirae bacterium GWC2_57_13]|nr:MAG: ATP-dependent DNA helicase RecQ [Nitrospirae bacterium GWC1_57_7]OGW27369.1 MAG: ATP-dependent DNA helicase RecQ [Nitrospirae bacterium GWC2_57_13]
MPQLQHTPSIHHTLQTVFGFDSFRPNQEDIIRAVLEKRDVFAVMPTGCGKSICYQLPAVLMEGTAVVISPLISLMKDQVDAAKENGIAADYLNSSLNAAELSGVVRRLKGNQLKLLYIAPERFAMPQFVELLRELPLSLFAIDEAHCISEWGHDFRPDYLSLSAIPAGFPGVPVAAFTATASEKVQQDIIGKIGLRAPYCVRASFNRPNLFYQVAPKTGLDQQLLGFLKEHEGEAGIIYRTTRDSVEATAGLLSAHGIQALPYHAGLPAEVRDRNQEAFNRDEISVIVATIAFGMGIDKSNVRFVVHADLPEHIEAYYQETGRAGRDGEPAHCLLLFSRGDIPRIRYFIDKLEDEAERTISLKKLNQTVRFASHNACRRKQLLAFFGEAYPADNCGACDICTGNVNRTDITTDAKILMSAMARTNERFGIIHVMDVVMGADTKRVREMGHHGIKTFGAGRHGDKHHWRFIVDELLAQELIVQDGDRYPVLKLTPRGRAALTGTEQVFGLKREEKMVSERRRKGAGDGPFDAALFEKLRIVRKRLAEANHVPPYVIFSDKTLHEMSRHYPATPADMRRVHGVGDVKLERYGADFVAEIKAYVDDHPGIQAGSQSSPDQAFNTG